MSGPILLAATTIAFRGATLIDGTGAPPVANALLVVSDGRVVSVGLATPAAIAALPPGTEVRNCEGKWIVPGLIDAHVHAESDRDLQTMLDWGITTVRLMEEDTAKAVDLSARSATRRDIPHVFAAAPIFTTKGGWWDQGQPADRNLNRFPATPDEARAAVRKAKALGTREIKVMLDDMAWCRAPKPPLPKVSRPVLEALLGEAQDLGLRAIVHAPNLEDAKAALAAGATSLAHGILDPLDDETLAFFRRKKVAYVPTMDIFEFLADPRRDLDRVLGPSGSEVERWLEPATVRRLRSREYSDHYREGYPNLEYVERHLPALRENVRKLKSVDALIGLGTDMWAYPGLAVSVEMDLYVRAGLTPIDALRAGTQGAAHSLGLLDRGTLEPDRRADLLVLDADPLQDVRNVRRIAEMWKEGERVGPRSPSERRGP
ncbi:MAG TPA: amidohydrolase family protein [Thermoanaerobaculia bacterium]|nr:amidohydrolase family protein [Thermoanaerobaculia bacterium]